MKSMSPYLFFNGQCRQALEFYAHCLDGEIPMLQTFGEAPAEMQMPPGAEDRVMHADFKAENVYFMASDGMPGQTITPSNAMCLSVDFTDPDEQAQAFHELAEGGEVTMALQDTFWGSRFGMVTDKFGVQWMLSYQKE